MATDEQKPTDDQPTRLRGDFGARAALSQSGDIFGGSGFGMEAALPSEVRRVLQAKLSLGTVPEMGPEGAALPYEKPMPLSGGFEYGWCYTDHKAGKEIRQDWRKVDYLQDEPYATRVHAMLEQLGLPIPRAEEVYRGTNHDLLFLNSHGVVVRIGPLDAEDLINPGILQPLGWLEDRENMIGDRQPLPLTVALYPGIELDRQYDKAAHKPALAGSLYDLLTATQQGTDDIGTEGNTGIIRVLDDDGKEVAVRMLVDADNRFNGSSAPMREKKSSRLREQSGSAGAAPAALGRGDILFNTLCTVFNAVKNVRYWEKACEAHEPLRRMFWYGFGGVEAVSGLPDTEARDKFWATCAAVVNKPMEITVPVWHRHENPDGKASYVREELYVPHLVLYRPWTSEEADRIVQPIKQSKGFREAVAEEHGKVCAPPPDDHMARLNDFDSRMKKFMDGADKNLGQRLASFGRRVWREIKNF